MEYKLGDNYLIWKAPEFATGGTYSLTMWSPTLVKVLNNQAFTELESGLYYISYSFKDLGMYFGVVFDNGVATSFVTFRVVYRTFSALS